jgi:hypothetical protein
MSQLANQPVCDECPSWVIFDRSSQSGRLLDVRCVLKADPFRARTRRSRFLGAGHPAIRCGPRLEAKRGKRYAGAARRCPLITPTTGPAKAALFHPEQKLADHDLGLAPGFSRRSREYLYQKISKTGLRASCRWLGQKDCLQDRYVAPPVAERAGSNRQLPGRGPAVDREPRADRLELLR